MSISQEKQEAFLRKLHSWAATLSPEERELLERVSFQMQGAGAAGSSGTLSEDQLKAVVGGKPGVWVKFGPPEYLQNCG